DQVNVVTRADELQLEEAAPTDRLQQPRHRPLELLVTWHRQRVGADPAVRRRDPQRDLVDGTDELALPGDSGDGRELPGEERRHEPALARQGGDRLPELVDVVDAADATMLDPPGGERRGAHGLHDGRKPDSAVQIRWADLLRGRNREAGGDGPIGDRALV